METNIIYNEDCLLGMDRIPDKSIDMILCDLPYGTTRCRWDTVIPFEPLWKQYKRIIKDNGAIVLFSAEPFTSFLITSQIDLYRYDLIWNKERGSDFMNANRKPLKSHENIVVFYKKSPTYNKQFWYSTPYKRTKNGALSDNYGDRGAAYSESEDGKRNPLSVLSFPKDDNKLHPTQKPVALCEYLIKTYTNEGETVLDNCIGAGTTAIACINTSRNYIGFELDTGYFNITNERIANQLK